MPEHKEILFRLNNTKDNMEIAPVIISLINNTLSSIIIFSNENDNFNVPFSFFEDHSQLCYFRYTKEVAGFLECYMDDYHWKYLNCDDNSDNPNTLDSHLTPKQQDYLEYGKICLLITIKKL